LAPLPPVIAGMLSLTVAQINGIRVRGNFATDGRSVSQSGLELSPGGAPDQILAVVDNYGIDVIRRLP